MILEYLINLKKLKYKFQDNKNKYYLNKKEIIIKKKYKKNNNKIKNINNKIKDHKCQKVKYHMIIKLYQLF